MKKLNILLAVVIGLFLVAPAQAQTYLSSTTLGAAVTTTSGTAVTVASSSGITANTGIYVDWEYMVVVSVPSSTQLVVQRGAGGTVSSTHRNGATVIEGAQFVFRTSDPAGACTASNYQYLPLINILNGNVWLCRYTSTSSTSTVWAATNAALITYNSLLLNLR